MCPTITFKCGEILTRTLAETHFNKKVALI